MGIVQKIFYLHVPCAMALQAMFVTSGIASIVYLVKPSRAADQLAVAAAEVGVVMAAAALTSGPLWARKAWGHYWEWEPRLTLTLVLAFMFAAYVALRSFGGSDDMTRRIAAGLAIAGLPAIFLVRVAVQWWRGTHPRVVWTGGLDSSPDMKLAFWMGVFGMLCFCSVLTWERYRVEKAKNDVDDLALAMMERDLLEEDHL
ncbi:MAG: heme exporter protein C [Myxococcota bacterium]|jgi:heme exporter protein C